MKLVNIYKTVPLEEPKCEKEKDCGTKAAVTDGHPCSDCREKHKDKEMSYFVSKKGIY